MVDIHSKAPSGDPDNRFVAACEIFLLYELPSKSCETDMLLNQRCRMQLQKALHLHWR